MLHEKGKNLQGMRIKWVFPIYIDPIKKKKKKQKKKTERRERREEE